MCAITSVMQQQLFRLKIDRESVRSAQIGANLLAGPIDREPAMTTAVDAEFDEVAALTVGTLGVDGLPVLMNRLFYWPMGFVPDSLVGVVSSRIDRQPESWRDWFRALRSVCSQLDSDTERLVVADGTTTAIYAERAADLFGKRTLLVSVDPIRSLESWWKVVQQPDAHPTDDSSEAIPTTEVPSVAKVFVSPPIGDNGEELPARDVIVHALATRITALHVSNQGSIRKLMQQRLSNERIPSSSTRLLLSNRTSATVTNELLDQGCVGWHVTPRTHTRTVPDNSESKSSSASQPSSKSTVPAQPTAYDDVGWSVTLEEGAWLTHCTRRRFGPWPNQTAKEHVDDLLFEQPSADHSPLSALKRIVSQARLIASSEGVRGETGVVCFTAVNLDELASLRVFRPHRGRWDFEPYGLCVSKRWLEDLGAQAVRYASASELDSILRDEQHFYQLRASQSSSGKVMDWTVEEEWRVAGDVDLSAAGPDDVVVFAPTEREAVQLGKLKNWRVAYQVN